MEEKGAIKEAASLLRKASDVLFALESNEGQRTNSRGHGASSSNSACSDNGPSSNSVSQTLARARAMMHMSSSRGVLRRLNQNERLRASSTTQNKKAASKKEKVLEDKPFEFALIRGEEDPEVQEDTLKRSMVIERGMVTLTEKDSESIIREKIMSSLKEKYSMIGPTDFDFIKVTQKKISVMNLSKGTEYNYAVLKKMVGQGTLYIRMKPEFQCLMDEDETSLQDHDDYSIDNLKDDDDEFSTSVFEQPSQQQQHQEPTPPSSQSANGKVVSNPPMQDAKRDDDFFTRILYEFPPSIIEPTEMLRYLQNKIVSGRPLDITDETTDLKGETNYITIDRDKILETTFEELKSIENPKLTFEVQFYGEKALDSGGPRKEWIRLCNQSIKAKYFDHGLKEHLSSDYFFVGQMAGIALLQNGQRPMYFPEDVLQDVFNSDVKELSPCLKELHEGMATLGLPQFGQRFPIFLHLFRPTDTRLTVKIMVSLLQPKFSEKGTNKFTHEKAVYTKLVKYMREVEAGRRVVSLENILEFVTGSSEEPTLGFSQSPSIEFVTTDRDYDSPQTEMAGISHAVIYVDDSTQEASSDQAPEKEPSHKKKKIMDFVPKAHTCSCTLTLPRGDHVIQLPTDDRLFNIYDFAFKNTYFGVF